MNCLEALFCRIRKSRPTCFHLAANEFQILCDMDISGNEGLYFLHVCIVGNHNKMKGISGFSDKLHQFIYHREVLSQKIEQASSSSVNNPKWKSLNSKFSKTTDETLCETICILIYFRYNSFIYFLFVTGRSKKS